MSHLKQLETFLFEKLQEFSKQNTYLSPAYDDEEIYQRGFNAGKVESICQVIDKLIIIMRG